MKTLLTLFAIILSVGVANAQTKKPVVKKTDTPEKRETPAAAKGPSLEETVAYINDILSTSLGVIDVTDSYSIKITNQKFSLDAVSVTREQIFESGKSLKTTISYSGIPWHTLKNKINPDNLHERVDLQHLFLEYEGSFTANKKKSSDTRINGWNDSEERQTKDFFLYVMPSKAEKLKKALLHLRELTYKPDPFD